MKSEGSADDFHTDYGLLGFRNTGLATDQVASVMDGIGLFTMAAVGRLVSSGKFSVNLLRQEASSAIESRRHLINLLK